MARIEVLWFIYRIPALLWRQRSRKSHEAGLGQPVCLGSSSVSVNAFYMYSLLVRSWLVGDSHCRLIITPLVGAGAQHSITTEERTRWTEIVVVKEYLPTTTGCWDLYCLVGRVSGLGFVLSFHWQKRVIVFLFGRCRIVLLVLLTGRIV